MLVNAANTGSDAPSTGLGAPRLTNLAHLDWLRARVLLTPVSGHSTYRLDVEPAVEVVWTYAERDAEGELRRVGGGVYDPAADRYGQGAFNTDDIARAAVVYLRHWRGTGASSSRTAAYQLLRAVAYMQTDSGPDAGNSVLWMQPDGTLEHSADPPETPDPSDSAESYWVARSVWAFGEGYEAFRDEDAEFAAFLAGRLALALDALERQSLARYGEHLRVDGAHVPAWLLANGADATGEALLGLAAYVRSSDDARARRALARYAEGVAAQRSGDPYTWPFGAVLPWALHRAVWHAWGGLAPAGLARAYGVTGDPALRDAVLADTASFTPHLLVAAGPDNAWQPEPADLVQIAYGAQSRVEALLAAARYVERPGLGALAGVAAAWFFGNNPAGAPVYDEVTGCTYDGVDLPGVVHTDSGAESTIHGLLAMLALDDHPEVAAIARTATVRERHTWSLVQAGDDGIPPLTFPPPETGPVLVYPLIERHPAAGTTAWVLGDQALGTVEHGPPAADPGPHVAGPLGPATADDGWLGVTCVAGTATVRGVLIQPEIEWLTLGQPDAGHGTALVRSFAYEERTVVLAVPGDGAAEVCAYDPTGLLVARHAASGGTVDVCVPAGGFALVRR